jgi:hypothetical protein
MNTSKLWAGASGYAFKEWKGSFYPEKIPPEAMLAWYAERLPAVEINNTFYQMPKVAVLAHWVEGDARGLSLRDQGVAPHHPRCAPQGRCSGRLHRLPLQESRDAGGQARTGAVSAAALSQEGPASPQRVPAVAARRPPRGLRIPQRELV